jgi:hypothetical protein
VDTEAIARLTHILQLSITPVALISGVGLLLLSMTNRMGRVMDRARHLGRELTALPLDQRAASLGAGELRVLFRRARLLQFAVALVVMSIFLAMLMIGALFAMNLLAAESLSVAVLVLFGICLVCTVASLACFLGDIMLSIRWLHLSLGPYVAV